jgi:hypothetical protein
MDKTKDTQVSHSHTQEKPPESLRGSFTMKIVDGKILWNDYDCRHCKDKGIEHTVRNVPHGYTDGSSCWGRGIATTRRECSACGRWDGPWVDADIVGGGY